MQLSKSIPYLIPVLFFCHFAVHGQSVLIQKEQNRLPFIKDSISLVNSLNRIGMLYHMKNPDSCFYFGMKAKTIATRLHYPKGQTDADNVIAAALYLKGLFKESLELFSTVLARYRQQADTANEVQALMNMASVYAGVADSAQAKMLSRKAIRTGRRLKQDSIMSLVYDNYCIVNSTLSDDSVRYYLDKSRTIANRYKDERMLIAILQTEAQQLLNKGHKKEAFPMIGRSLSRSQNAGLEYLEINSLDLYATYYTEKPDSVLRYYKRIYQLIQNKGYTYLKVPVLKVILTYTELSGKKDQIISVHRLTETALGAENDNLKKFIGDYIKYNAIQSANTTLAKKNKNDKTKILLLIAVCCVSIPLVIFIYYMYRHSRRLNRKISEQNNQMRTTLSALEQSQAENTRIMRIVAHDLRNPIGAIYSVASLMLEDPEHSEDDRTMLELIKTSGQNSLNLVSDLLQVHIRGEELKKEPVDLSQMLHYCADLLHFKAEAKGQHIELRTAPVILSVNREKMWRVASNLIANAIKFSPSGANIVVQLEEKPQMVIIAVEDNGIGIPVEMGTKIFDMFTEAKRPGTNGEQPFGLGLAISKQIVEAHGGNIRFESSTGNGTTFYVELPVS